MSKYDKTSLEDLRTQVRITMGFICSELERVTEKTGATFTCECEDPYIWDRDMCLEYLEENSSD